MNSEKKTKSPKTNNKVIRRLKKLLLTFEIIFGILLLASAIIIFVPNVKTTLAKELATTPIGKNIIKWFGKADYDNSIFDKEFNSDKVKTNDLKYNYSEEYTNFVMFGVDSRLGEVNASNSDSILIVSLHNTTGEVKMVSVYRDTMLGIYNTTGTLNKYFKVNSAYAGGGPEAALNTLNMNLDLDLKDYVTVNFAGVAKVIDTLGGITVNLTDDEVQQLNYHLGSTMSSTGEKAKKIKKSGKNIRLNGIQATTYCRIRKATFYDPETGKAISNDFGRAARQRSVMMKLVDSAKKASMSELQNMVSAVMNDNTDSNQIISTSFSFDEIVNLIPVIFKFKLSGSEGFPSNLTTGTIDGASYVIPKGLSANVTELHKYFYGEKNYQPTSTVNTNDSYITGQTGISATTEGGYDESLLTTNASEKEKEKSLSYDYDDKGKSDFY